MLDKKNMGLRIRRAREQKHWTREQLAEKLELSVNAVADLERGKSGTRLETLVKLCALLGLSADYVPVSYTHLWAKVTRTRPPSSGSTVASASFWLYRVLAVTWMGPVSAGREMRFTRSAVRVSV